MGLRVQSVDFRHQKLQQCASATMSSRIVRSSSHACWKASGYGIEFRVMVWVSGEGPGLVSLNSRLESNKEEKRRRGCLLERAQLFRKRLLEILPLLDPFLVQSRMV